MGKNVQRKGVLIKGTTLHGTDLKEIAKKNNIGTISYTSNMGVSFGRVLAKIAYGMVIFNNGIDSIEEAYVLPSILGSKDDVGQWVGCEKPNDSPATLPKAKLFHKIEILEEKNQVGARIRLFGAYQTPEYIVFVGRLKDKPTS
jgi:hypothetical protein